MKLANIYPISAQQLYKKETYVMLLAQFLSKGKYDPKYFNDSQYVMLDNGLYEKTLVSTNLQDIINIAEKSEIKIDEIVVPDVFGDCDGTIKLFEKNLNTIKKYQHKYKFMVVAQASNYGEFSTIMHFFNTHDTSLNLSIGIPKLSVVARDSVFAISEYRKCIFPIHFLGIKNSFSELLPASELIRGCDSSQVAYISKNESNINIDTINYVRKGVNIPLETETLNIEKTKEVLARTIEGFKLYGVL